MKQKLKQWFQSEIVWALMIAIFTALSSEIKLSPFSGDNFRFGMGTVTFLLMLLIRPPKNYLLVGLLTTFIIIGFRMMVQINFAGYTPMDSLMENYPGGMYYLIYIIGFNLLGLTKYLERPIILGLLAMLLELMGNTVEHILRIISVPTIEVDVFDWLLLVAVALFRSFFVVGLFTSVTLSEQKKRLEEQLTVGSGLYIETLYLQKSMNHIEQIMADSYELYRLMKKQDKELGKKALHIAQEIHEVKKDSQRIYSGLSEITPKIERAYYTLSEVLEMVVVGNRKYAAHLSKKVMISKVEKVDFVVKEQLLLMAIINNLIANAVESIPTDGVIKLKVEEINSIIRFQIHDSGKGISKEEIALIFEPGFTTKFSEKGVAATGIGLSHVKEAIKQLDGEINVHSNLGEGTVFTVRIPKNKIEQEA